MCYHPEDKPREKWGPLSHSTPWSDMAVHGRGFVLTQWQQGWSIVMPCGAAWTKSQCTSASKVCDGMQDLLSFIMSYSDLGWKGP